MPPERGEQVAIPCPYLIIRILHQQLVIVHDQSGILRVLSNVMPLHAVVLATAAETPDAPAITAGAVTITYRELVDRAGGLAIRLRDVGVSAESFVGVVVDQSADSLVAFLGVLMAGGAYVPIAADLPADRIRAIAEEANLAAITGAPVIATKFAPFMPVDGPASKEPPVDTDADQAAYAIFTSGSTGRPKGVIVTHAAAVASTRARFEVYPHDVITYLVSAPLTIDAAVAGLYFTLFSGGRIVLPSADEQADPGLLAEVVARERITHFDGLPSLYALLLEFHADALRSLHCVVLGGESLPYKLSQRHLAELPATALFNEYGPTEGTVWCAVHRCTMTDPGPRVPIGRGIQGMRTMVLTEDLSPAVPGRVGEICISGTGLARGYLGQPAKTAERFIPNPTAPGERMYRTGDLGTVLTDGAIEFHGRADDMVKVRGFRVEINEVEARVLEHPDVTDAVVVLHDNGAGVRLVAVITVAAGHSVGCRALAEFAGYRLSRYMVPTVWRQVDTLPVTAAGKVDRIGLAASALTTGTALPR